MYHYLIQQQELQVAQKLLLEVIYGHGTKGKMGTRPSGTVKNNHHQAGTGLE